MEKYGRLEKNDCEKENKEKILFQENTKFTISIDRKSWTFEFDNIKDFLKFISLTIRIINIYKKTNKYRNIFFLGTSNKFYLLVPDNSNYENLYIDNRLLIPDTVYLRGLTLEKYIGNKNKQLYVDFLNTIKDKNQINLKKLENQLINEYKKFIDTTYSNFKLILKDELALGKHNQISKLYDDYCNILKRNKKYKIKSLKRFYDTIEKTGLYKDIVFSAILLKNFLKNGYKPIYPNDYSLMPKNVNEEIFKYIKLIFPKDIKVEKRQLINNEYKQIPEYENYSKKFDYIRFDFDKNGNITILGVDKNGKTPIGTIFLTDFYKKILIK